MDLSEYRSSEKEKLRVADLLKLIPEHTETALDVGARDGFLSKLIVETVAEVTALDLIQPVIEDERIHCVKGDITALEFKDNSFDLVFCAEVPEHIPTNTLHQACDEPIRVASKHILVGVPYKQDIRRGRTTCAACGGKKPPWGHVNKFYEKSLAALFSPCSINKISYAGTAELGTNFVASALMDVAGNPFGTYSQEEPCIYCGVDLIPPQNRTMLSRLFSKAGFYAQKIRLPSQPDHANWIHILFST